MRLDNLDWMDGPEGTRLATSPTGQELDRIISKESWRECRQRVGKVVARLDEVFVEKTKVIELMCWATATRMPMLLLGPWGTGKSFLVRSFARCLGLQTEKPPAIQEAEQELADLRKGQKRDRPARRYFEYLVTRFTTPEELLGPVEMEVLLKQSRHFRQTQGLLPQAEVAFLDEVFKANSAILNALLTLINERLFYNAGRAWSTDLVVLFGASNEPPQEEELGAFFDRFPIRVLCDRVSGTPETLTQLLARSHAQEYAKQHPAWALGSASPGPGSTAPKIERLASLNDFRLLHHVSFRLFGGENVETKENRAFLEAYLRVVSHLRGQFDISDRSCGYYYRLARMRALLADRTDLKPEDCEVLAYAGKDVEAARQLPEIVRDWIRAA